jgi:amicyanin
MARIVLLLALLGPALGLLLAPPPASAAADHHVMISNFTFSNAALTVRAGDTVTWTNHDQVPHDVVSSSGPAVVRSPLMDAGQSFSFAFTAPGTYALYCSVHPEMRAQVVVLPPDTPAPAPAPAQQPAPAPPPAAPAQQPQPPTPTATEAAPAPTTAAESESAVAVPDQPAQAQNAQVATARVEQRLDPMLLVAGVVAAIAVLCLLLIGARPEQS